MSDKGYAAMSLRGLALLAVMAVAVAGVPVTAACDETDDVRKVAMDYVEGAYAGDTERVAGALDCEVHKVLVMEYPPTGGQITRVAGYSMIVEIVRSGRVNTPAEERDIEIEVYAVKGGIAAVKIGSKFFTDYLMLARRNGEWKITSVLYDFSESYLRENRPAALEPFEGLDPAEEEAAIMASARDYIEGYFTGDAKRMDRAVYPELVKMRPAVIPQTGRMALEKIGKRILVEATAGGGGVLDESEWGIEARLLDRDRGIAMVEIISSQFFDYLQLARIGGRWQIMNVLWVPNPDRENK